MTNFSPYPIIVGQTVVDPGNGFRLLKGGEQIRAGDECSFYDRRALRDRYSFFAEVTVIWEPADYVMVGDIYTGACGAFWMRRKVQAPGAMEGRRYGFSLAPQYLKLTIWTFNEGGERLRSEKIYPIKGLTHRQRYDALCDFIRNVGCVPPKYDDTRRA